MNSQNALGVVDTAASGVKTAGLTFWDMILKLYDNPFVSKLIAVIFAIIVAFLLISLSKIISVTIRNKISKAFFIKQGEQFERAGAIIGDAIFYAMTMVSLYVAFDIVGINLGLLMGGITIGVGFAFRETLSNMISGIMIFSTKEYQIGNIIEIKDKDKTEMFGRIEEINMQHTIIRGFDLKRYVTANSIFLKKPIKTYNMEALLRYDMQIKVPMAGSVKRIMEITNQTINSFDFIQNKQYTQVLVDNFTEKDVALNLQFYFDPNTITSTEIMKSYIQTALIENYKALKAAA